MSSPEPSGRRPTIDDVARRAGVSKGAVSFAFNNRPGVSEDTRARILAAADELGWRPRASAKALSVGRAMAVGMVMARATDLIGDDPFFGQLLAGIESALAPAGYVLVVGAAHDHGVSEAYDRLVADGRVDGMILTDGREGDERYEYLVSSGLAAVVVGSGGSNCPIPAVWSDESDAVEAAVRHLAELGHRRIAHVAGTDGLIHAEKRKAAWRHACGALGLDPGRCISGEFTEAGGASATTILLEDPTPPTAIVYASDVMAMAGMSAARRLGLRLPEDLSVVGFDDIAAASHLTPPLTTICQDHYALGEVAAATLLAALGEQVPPARPIPAPRLVIRGSAAAPFSR